MLILAHWKIIVKLETHLKSIQLDRLHVMFVDFGITCFVLDSLKPQFQVPRTNTFVQCVFRTQGRDKPLLTLVINERKNN